MNRERFTLVLDSSQIVQWLECPQLWYYNYHDRLLLKEIADKAATKLRAMDMGSYGHRLLEIYYKLMARGIGFNDRLAQAYSFNPDDDVCECGCTKADHRMVKEFKTTCCLRCQHCHEGYKPVPYNLEKKDRDIVRNRLQEYWAKYNAKDFHPLSDKSVEVGFSEVIYEDSDNYFVLEGRIDLIAEMSGLELLVDHKFQERKFDLYQKSIQFRNYCLVAKKTLLLINYIRLAAKFDPEITLVRVPVTFSIQELRAWKNTLIDLFMKIKYMLMSGSINKNYSSCMGKFGSLCQFTPLCEEIDPDMVEAKKNSFYTIKEAMWRPW